MKRNEKKYNKMNKILSIVPILAFVRCEPGGKVGLCACSSKTSKRLQKTPLLSRLTSRPPPSRLPPRWVLRSLPRRPISSSSLWQAPIFVFFFKKNCLIYSESDLQSKQIWCFGMELCCKYWALWVPGSLFFVWLWLIGVGGVVAPVARTGGCPIGGFCFGLVGVSFVDNFCDLGCRKLKKFYFWWRLVGTHHGLLLIDLWIWMLNWRLVMTILDCFCQLKALVGECCWCFFMRLIIFLHPSSFLLKLCQWCVVCVSDTYFVA